MEAPIMREAEVTQTAREEREAGKECAGLDRLVVPDATGREPAGKAGSCSPAALWGWSPPPRPADTALQRLVDRLLPRTGLACALYFAAVIGLLNLARVLPAPSYLLVDGLAALAAGSWCGLNFWRCRHAHCLISGGDWLGLSGFVFIEAGLGRSLIGGNEQVVFLGVLVAALLFEGAFCLARGANAIGPSRRSSRATSR